MPDPEKHAAIARMQQLRADGVSLRKIVAQMSAEGVRVTMPTLLKLTAGVPAHGRVEPGLGGCAGSEN